MRFKRKVAAHVEERVEDAGVSCDGCGIRVDKQPVYRDDEVTIEARIGDVYPEGDQRTVYELDLCGQCFLEKALPALRAAGLVPREHGAYEDGRAWE